MKPFVFDSHQAELKRWLSAKLPAPDGYSAGHALGIAADQDLLAVVIFHNARRFPTGATTCEVGIAATDKRWATRSVLRSVFAYPFEERGVACLRTTCPRKSKKLRKFNARLGFRFEGIGRCLLDGKQDAAVFSMLPEECKWLR